MGWLVYDYRGKKVVAHGGMIDGFRVQITFLPDENLGFAVLSNLHDTRMTLAVTNTLIDLYCGLQAARLERLLPEDRRRRGRGAEAALAARDKARDPNAKPIASARRLRRRVHAPGLRQRDGHREGRQADAACTAASAARWSTSRATCFASPTAFSRTNW